MDIASAAVTADLLLDTLTAARAAKKTTTRSTIDARDLGATQGRHDGVVALTAQLTYAHPHRVASLASLAVLRLDNTTRALSGKRGHTDASLRRDAVEELAVDLLQLHNRETCGDRLLWRDEDVAMARPDLAPYRCLRIPGHDGQCEMHPRVAEILNRGGAPDHEDYLAPVTA